MSIRSSASSPSCRAARRTLGAALLALLGACASAPPAAVEPEGLPWEIPASALGTQQLFRMSYSGPRGEGSFRLALRLESAVRYQANAVDPLGRALWSLDVTADRGLFLDHRARAACALESELRLVGAPLDRVALTDLPKLLLGRVPVSPPAETPAPAGVNAGKGLKILVLSGAAGESWQVHLARGRLFRWTLIRVGEPTAWWTIEKGESILSDRTGGQLRWRASVAEPLASPLVPLAAPADYAREGCAALALGGAG